jgi:hypothetical protein
VVQKLETRAIGNAAQVRLDGLAVGAGAGARVEQIRVRGGALLAVVNGYAVGADPPASLMLSQGHSPLFCLPHASCAALLP